jgi:hypothetical protein
MSNLVGIAFHPERDDEGFYGYYLYGDLSFFWQQQNENFYLEHDNGLMKVKMQPEQALLFYLSCPEWTDLLKPVNF